MLIIVRGGAKTFRKFDGIAADFCTICRDTAIVDVYELRSQASINGVGVGQGNLVAHVCSCQTCKAEWHLRQGTIQGVIAPDLYTTWESLVMQTFPHFGTVFAERFAQEATIRQDPFALDAETRRALIAEPFYLVANSMEAGLRRATTWQSVVGGLSGAAGVGLAVVAGVTLTDHSPVSGSLELLGALGLGAMAIGMSASLTHKFMKQRAYPQLARGLAPLRPSPEELSEAMRTVGARSTKRIKVKTLLPLLNAPRVAVSSTQPALADA